MARTNSTYGDGNRRDSSRRDSSRRSSRASSRRSSRASSYSSVQVKRHEAYLGRKCCFAATVMGVVVAIAGGFGVGYVVYPYMVGELRTANVVTPIDIQFDDDTETVLLTRDDDSTNSEPEVATGTQRIGIDSLECGKPTVTEERIFQLARISNGSPNFRKKKIVGREVSSLLSFPWQVSLWRKNHHACGGSIISSNWIITAAHCTHPYPSPENWTVYAEVDSITEMNSASNGTQKVALTDVISHPHFDKITFENDVALMRLQHHLRLGSKVTPICLPSLDEKPEIGDECLISGWGALREGVQIPKELQKATVGIIDRLVCNDDNWLMGLVLDDMLCAGTESGNMHACQGDSGGPLSCVRKSTGQFYLPGLVSWGIGCGEPSMPGVYTDVVRYRSWIVQTVQSIEQKYA